MTLLELMLAMSLMVMVVAALGAIAKGVQSGFEFSDSYGTATQHARVTLERIQRTVAEAKANEQFPGLLVLADTLGTWRFPDTLVIWHPSGTPANPDGLPLYRELVIYCPDPTTPNVLLEVTAPNDGGLVPAATDTAAWTSAVRAIKTASTSQRVTLTDILYSATPGGVTGTASRGAVRFESRVLPSLDDWAGATAWAQLPWAQGVSGPQSGLRQTWVRFELQLKPQSQDASSPDAARPPVPFFGSAALCYSLRQSKRGH